jgi:hypothetical protein
MKHASRPHSHFHFEAPRVEKPGKEPRTILEQATRALLKKLLEIWQLVLAPRLREALAHGFEVLRGDQLAEDELDAALAADDACHGARRIEQHA